jgi:hypothetical protein
MSLQPKAIIWFVGKQLAPNHFNVQTRSWHNSCYVIALLLATNERNKKISLCELKCIDIKPHVNLINSWE